MPGKSEIVAGIRVDGEKQFKDSITSINKSVTTLKSELALTSAEYEGQANSIEALRKKDEILNRILEEQKKKVETTNQALENAIKSYESAGTSVGKLKGAYDDQIKKQNELSQAYEQAQQRLSKMEQERNSSERSMEKQKATVKQLGEELEAQNKALEQAKIDLEKGEQAYQKVGNKAQDWKNKLNTAQSQLIKANRAVGENARYLKEAEESTDGCAKSIDEFGKKVEDAGELTTSFGEKVKMALTTKGVSVATDALKAVADKVKEIAVESDAAATQLQAAGGLSEELAEKYQDAMESIHGDNYGEDYADISEAMGQIVQVMGQLDPTAMKETAESAITLRDTFDMDYNETIRAADSLMKNMGLTGQEAFDYIAKGAQNGLNRSNELVDNLTEYSQLWGQAGFSAEEMFAILDNGLNNGAYNLDKVNDYVKEFGISLSDGRMEDNLASFSTETQKLFKEWKTGGATTKDVFYSVIDDLSNMTSEQEALTLASTMWSAVGEDNSLKVIQSLDDVNDKYKDVKGTMEELKEVKYSDLGSSVESLGRAVQENFLDPIKDAVVPELKKAIDGITEAIDPPKTKLEEFIEDVSQANDQARQAVENAQGIMSGAASEVGELEAYKDTLLELNGAAEKTEFQKFQLKEIVSDLSGSIPELAAAFDEETGSINLTNEEITDLINNQEDLIRQQAAMEARKEAYGALYDAELNKKMADDAVAEAEKAYEEIKKLNDETKGLSWGWWGKYADEEAVAKKAVESARKEQEEANTTQEEAQKLYNLTSETLKELGESADGAKAPLADIGDGMQTLGEGAEAAISPSTNLIDTLADTGQQAEETAETVSGAGEEMAESADLYAEAQQSALERVREAYQEAKDSIAGSIHDTISLLEEFDGGENVTTDQMKQNLDSQLTGIEEWGEDMEYLAQHIGGDFTAEMFDELLKLGPGGKEIIGNLRTELENGGENFSEIVKKWGILDGMEDELSSRFASISLAYKAGVDGLGESTAEDFEDLSSVIAQAAENAGEGWDGLTDATREKLDEAVQAAKNAGVDIPEGLSEGIQSGEISAEQALDALNGAIKGQFDGLAEIAKERGIEIPESIQAGIEEGGPAAEAAMVQLLQLLADASTSEQGKEAGKTYTSSQAESINENAGEVEAAAGNVASQAADAAEGKAGEFNTAGNTLIGAMGEGMTSNQDAITSAASSAAQAGANEASANTGGFVTAGRNMSAGIAQGIIQGSPEVQSAARQVVKEGEAAANNEAGNASPSKKWKKEVGLNLSKGTALGILDGKKDVEDASTQMARAAFDSAKAEAEIASPSKKFKREIGEQIGKGTAWGIKNSAKEAKKAGKQMSKDVLEAATEWLEEYSLNHKVSLEDEKYFWQQVKKETKKGTDAYKEASREISRIKQAERKIDNLFGVERKEKKDGKTVTKSDKEYYSEILQEAKTYLDNKKVIYDISLREEEAYWQSVSAKLKRGTQAWYDAQKELKSVRADIQKQAQEAKEAQKEAAQEAREALVSEGETYVSRQRLKGKMDDGQELSYWKDIKSQLKRGTDEWWDVYEKIKELEGDIAEAEEEAKRELEEAQQELMDYALSGSALEDYKTYFQVSAKAEEQYWDIVRKKFKEGTEERIEADRQYLEAKKEFEQELLDLQEEYKDKEEEILEERDNNVKDLLEAYEDAVQDTANSIKSATGLFDAFESESVDGATLIYNLKTQVIGIQDWREQLQKLKDKGLDQGLIDELTAMGPEISATLHILNNDRVGELGMTEEQLKEYEQLWKEYNDLVEEAAKEQNEKLKEETDKKVQQIQDAADAELDALKQEYAAGVQELSAAISKPLETLANSMGTMGSEAVAQYIAGVTGEAAAEGWQVSQSVNTIMGSFTSSATSAGVAGQQAIQEYANGMASYSGAAQDAASAVARMALEGLGSKSHVTTAAGHGTQIIKGLEIGMKDESGNAVKTAEDIVTAMLRGIRKKAKINSPSGLFRDEAGAYIPSGIGEGVKKNMEAAVRPSEDMVDEMLRAAQAEMDRNSLTLRTRMEDLNFSGISRLNALAETPLQQSTTVTVNNGDLVSIMNQMLVTMQAFMEQEASKQIMLDKDTVVGELQPGISQTSAQRSKKLNRGRY